MARAAAAADLYPAYRRELYQNRAAPWVRLGAVVTTVVNVVFVWLDHYAFPDLFTSLLAVRGVLQLALLTVFFRTARSHPRTSLWVICLATGAMLLVVVNATGAATRTDYYVGLLLFLVGVPVLLPMTGIEAGAICSLVLAAFGTSAWLTDPAPVFETHVMHMIFLSAAGVVSVACAALLDRTRFRDFVRQKEVEQARDELKELDRAKSRFTANIHHELRTPLTLTLAPIESMMSGEFGDLTELQRQYLKTMHVNALRLLKLINNLLDLAKIESQQLELHCRQIEVGSLASDMIAGARPMAERKRVELQEAGLDSLPEIHADPDALEKIFTNLIGNSLKFTDPGGQIRVHGEVVEEGVHFVVEDTGLGIPPDQLGRIFDRFAQVDTSATRRHEGTGIGLSLCKELVDLHGGRIWAQSEGLGHGTEVHFVLPRGTPGADVDEPMITTPDGRAHSARQSFDALAAELDLVSSPPLRAVELERTVERWEQVEGQSGAKGANEPANAEAPAGAPEILVVEDNADMRRLMRFLLSKEFRVREASNGREALEAIQESEPTLVLTDIMMPEMTGVELCRVLKQDPERRAIPVVLVTSKAERATKVEGLELGADDFVTKPFHPRELLARVRSLVRLRVLQEELGQRNLALEHTNKDLAGALRELREAQAQLVHREKMASVGQLVAGIAHEINNPVNFIQGNLHFLEKHAAALIGLIEAYEGAAAASDSEVGLRFEALRRASDVDAIGAELRSIFAGCREGVERTARLVRDLGTFSRLDRSERTLVDVHEAIDSTLNLLRSRLAGIEVHQEYADLPELESLPGQLGQVIMNLLTNAADAVGASGQLSIRTARVDDDHVCIEVEDDGVGISPDEVERIFDPFFTTKEVGKGTGLGLSMTYGIVTRHGGTITVRSELGRGTCFRVELPIRMPTAAQSDDPTPQPR